MAALLQLSMTDSQAIAMQTPASGPLLLLEGSLLICYSRLLLICINQLDD
jgi:hypothetical protein